jgi:hypothetical protein
LEGLEDRKHICPHVIIHLISTRTEFITTGEEDVVDPNWFEASRNDDETPEDLEAIAQSYRERARAMRRSVEDGRDIGDFPTTRDPGIWRVRVRVSLSFANLIPCKHMPLARIRILRSPQHP